MQQTFSDMLEGERSRLGRVLIWTRALMDVPVSASKEHLTNGENITMNRTSKLLLLGALLAIVIVGLGSFWEGSLHARNTIGVEHVTTAQLADAMQQDSFYHNYGDAAVLFNGKVISVKTKANASLVTFYTGRSYAVVCQFPQTVNFSNGQTVSVAAPAGSAERQSHGVLLHNCLVN